MRIGSLRETRVWVSFDVEKIECSLRLLFYLWRFFFEDSTRRGFFYFYSSDERTRS